MTTRLPVLLLAAALLAGCSSGQSPVTAPSGPPTSDLRVGLLEYSFALSAGSLLPGAVTMTVTNAGSTGHDMRLYQGQELVASVPVLSPGERKELTFDVEPGFVRVDCSVGGHARAGMVARLAVASE